MGFRFRKSKKIMPGVRLNFSKKGVGVRVGGKHSGVSVGPGGTRASASIPGTGISYTTKLGGSKKAKSRSSTSKRTARPVNRKPITLRWWYLLLIVLMFIGGFGNLSNSIGAALCGIVIGLIMAAFTAITILGRLKDTEPEPQPEIVKPNTPVPPVVDENETPASSKSANGLYPHEILMLSYYKKYATGTEPARFWQYDYGVTDVPALLRKLKNLGFADETDLTDKGREELSNNEYVLYMHRHKNLGISMTDMSILVNKHPDMKYRDLIWGELQRLSLENAKYNKWSLHRNTQFNMYQFLMEEKKPQLAIRHLYDVAAFDINTGIKHQSEAEKLLPPGIIKAFRDIITKVDLEESDFISQMSEAYNVSASIRQLDAQTSASIAAAIVYGHPETIRF